MRPIFYGLLLTMCACSSEGVASIFGGSDVSIPPVVDLLFVVDNSVSMTAESKALGLSFSSFFDVLGSEMDVQVGITTSSVRTGDGQTGGLDLGEKGLLLGEIAVNGEPDIETKLQQQLYCGATFWDRDALPRDSSYNCGEASDTVSIEYLDCLCSDSRWNEVYGANSQEPLEAALLTLCRSVENPPNSCFEAETLSENDARENVGFIRSESAIVVTVVGDSGDGSRRMELGEEIPEVYQQAFADFDREIYFAAIGPNLTRETNAFICNTGGANYWMVERLYRMIEATEGVYGPLESMNADNNCELNPFSQHLEQLGEFVMSR